VNNTAQRPATLGSGCCVACAHFDDDPANFEATIKGLVSMGSAHASVRGRDGICLLHDRFCSATWSCTEFTAKSALQEDAADPPATNIA
jgi:hypothetical protein